jgi:hypothetical protein
MKKLSVSGSSVRSMALEADSFAVTCPYYMLFSLAIDSPTYQSCFTNQYHIYEHLIFFLPSREHTILPRESVFATTFPPILQRPNYNH